MTYALTFLSGVAVAAVLMWYYVGVVTKANRSPKVRLEYNAIAIACALIRAGHAPEDVLADSISLSRTFVAKIDKEVQP